MIDMPKEERIWVVLFTSAGLSELGEELKPYLSNGPLGLYLFCKEVNMSEPYFHMIVDYRNTDGARFETEFYVPHHYIKLVAAGTERRQISFI
jgi:hypothetical protein